MPVDTRIDIPFQPQESTTASILHAIQLANESHAQQQGIGLQQQQLGLQAQAQPSAIAERNASASRLNAQTELDKANLNYRQELMRSLIGTSQPQQSGMDQLMSAASGQPAPQPKTGGMIGQTVDNLLSDPGLSPSQKNAIRAAGQGAVLKSFMKPENALDDVVSTYNSALKENGETSRALKTEVVPDSQSSTGYSNRAVKPDGSEAYRVPAPAPMAKNLEEASSYLGTASLNYKREPTPGNEAALNLANAQHDALYQDRLAQIKKDAGAQAQARGADVEAMWKLGKNPITGEKLSLANAPPSALVNPATGEVVPEAMTSLYKPTMNERQTADTARQVLAISADLKDQIAKNPALIGPLAGRNKEVLQKLGVNAKDASKLIDDLSFLQSAATKMHTGRFSAEIMQKMGNLIKPGMGLDEFKGGLESINDVAQRYANEDKLTTVYEYQQRQQYEAQSPQAAPTKAPSVGQTVSIKGKQMKVTAVHPDGSFDAK